MPSEEEMRRAGFAPEDYAHDFVEVWPEIWPAARLFSSISNQWRTTGVGMGASVATALDYTVLFHRMDRLNLTDEEYEQMFSDVQAMESAALPVVNKPR